MKLNQKELTNASHCPLHSSVSAGFLKLLAKDPQAQLGTIPSRSKAYDLYVCASDLRKEIVSWSWQFRLSSLLRQHSDRQPCATARTGTVQTALRHWEASPLKSKKARFFSLSRNETVAFPFEETLAHKLVEECLQLAFQQIITTGLAL